MLKQNIDKLHLVANVLLERETLEGEELDQLLKTGKIEEKPLNKDEEPVLAPTQANPETEENPGPKIVYISKREETNHPAKYR